MPRAVDGLKACTACRVTRPVADFQRNRSTADGFHNQCRGCVRVANARWRSANPERKAAQNGAATARKTALKRYGLTEAEFESRLAAQGGVCAICSASPETEWRKFAVDHDHSCCATKLRSCGKCVRGILCSNCNTALGLMRDDPARLSAAIAYLTR